jgi:hypothetical protein
MRLSHVRLVRFAACGAAFGLLVGCTYGSGTIQATSGRTPPPRSPISSTSRSATKPDSASLPLVRGLSGRAALLRLHAAGFPVVRFNARRSDRPQSIVLAEHPRGGAVVLTHRRVELTISAGMHPPGPFAFVSGLSTCEMDEVSPKKLCVGGPVPAKVIAHRPSGGTH